MCNLFSFYPIPFYLSTSYWRGRNILLRTECNNINYIHHTHLFYNAIPEIYSSVSIHLAQRRCKFSHSAFRNSALLLLPLLPVLGVFVAECVVFFAIYPNIIIALLWEQKWSQNLFSCRVSPYPRICIYLTYCVMP